MRLQQVTGFICRGRHQIMISQQPSPPAARLSLTFGAYLFTPHKPVRGPLMKPSPPWLACFTKTCRMQTSLFTTGQPSYCYYSISVWKEQKCTHVARSYRRPVETIPSCELQGCSLLPTRCVSSFLFFPFFFNRNCDVAGCERPSPHLARTLSNSSDTTELVCVAEKRRDH